MRSNMRNFLKIYTISIGVVAYSDYLIDKDTMGTISPIITGDVINRF